MADSQVIIPANPPFLDIFSLVRYFVVKNGEKLLYLEIFYNFAYVEMVDIFTNLNKNTANCRKFKPNDIN